MIVTMASMPPSVTAVPTVVMVMVMVTVPSMIAVEPTTMVVMVTVLRVGRHAERGCDDEHHENCE